MTEEELIDMARKSDFEIHPDNLISFDGIDCTSELIAFAKLVAEKAIKEILSEPEQKYHRGDRLICLETEEYCVIHISGTDRQLVKFPDSHIGVYTNEQVAEMFELLPKELEQDPVAWEQFYPDIGKPKFVAQTEQEPVADVLIDHEDEDGHAVIWLRDYALENGRHLLYTTPPQRKPLTETQINDRARAEGAHNADFWLGVRFAEAAHNIKE